jgi:hypothetical protein
MDDNKCEACNKIKNLIELGTGVSDFIVWNPYLSVDRKLKDVIACIADEVRQAETQHTCGK